MRNMLTGGGEKLKFDEEDGRRDKESRPLFCFYPSFFSFSVFWFFGGGGWIKRAKGHGV